MAVHASIDRLRHPHKSSIPTTTPPNARNHEAPPRPRLRPRPREPRRRSGPLRRRRGPPPPEEAEVRRRGGHLWPRRRLLVRPQDAVRRGDPDVRAQEEGEG